MNIALWIASGLLAVAYLAVGAMKIVIPAERLARNPNMVAITEELSQPTIKLIGTVEILGALGLVVPWATDTAIVLTPAAAVGLALLQVGAIVFHGRRKEYRQWPVNTIYFALAMFVAAGRFTEILR